MHLLKYFSDPNRVLIGHGCFLAEPTCVGYNFYYSVFITINYSTFLTERKLSVKSIQRVSWIE